MVTIPFNFCKKIQWKLDVYEADGYYIKECYDNNSYDDNNDKHVYIDQDLCYYNFFTINLYLKIFFKSICIFFLYIFVYFYLLICIFLFLFFYFINYFIIYFIFLFFNCSALLQGQISINSIYN
jgi:hypothetical protein